MYHPVRRRKPKANGKGSCLDPSARAVRRLFFEPLRPETAFSRKFDYEDAHIGVSDERMGYETDEASERRKE